MATTDGKLLTMQLCPIGIKSYFPLPFFNKFIEMMIVIKSINEIVSPLL